MSSSLGTYGDPKQMSPLQIKNNPKGKKENQSHKVSEAGNWEKKNTNKKNRNIEKERVINRNI